MHNIIQYIKIQYIKSIYPTKTVDNDSTHTYTEDCDEKELSFMEEFLMISPQSDFVIFILAYLGIIVGIFFSTRIDGFVIGELNVGKLIGLLLGILVKRMIDNCKQC